MNCLDELSAWLAHSCAASANVAWRARHKIKGEAVRRVVGSAPVGVARDSLVQILGRSNTRLLENIQAWDLRQLFEEKPMESKIFVAFTAIVLASAASMGSTAAMADMFIKIGDIKGESADVKHKDEIDVLAWSWGMSQTGTTHKGTEGGAGKVNVQDMSVTKYVDKATPYLMEACATGKHLREAVLTVRKVEDSPVQYLKIKMTDVLITSVATGGSAEDERVKENVSLNFAKYKMEYTPQMPDGSAGAAVTTGFDITTNKKL
jgi:type VI secretion system secreted protein Hcp